MFKSWTQDTEELNQRAFSMDAKFNHLHKILMGFPNEEIEAVSKVLEQHFSLLKEVFIDRASNSAQYPGICEEKVKLMC